MIIPDDAAGNGNPIYNQNIQFAKKWVKHKPDERAFIQLAAGGRLEAAMEEAAKKARLGKGRIVQEIPRKIILFIGHGGTGDVEKKTMTSFDTVPESGKFDTHKHKVTELVLKLGMLIRSGEMVVKDPDPQAPDIRVKGGPKQREGSDTAHDEKMAVKYSKLLQLQRIAGALGKYRVSEFILLSCSVGGDTQGAQSLATLLGVKVGHYRDKVATADAGNNLIQIRLSPHDVNTDEERNVGKPKLEYDANKRPKEHPSLHDYPHPQITKG